MGAGASSKGKSPGSTAPNISPPPQVGAIGQSGMNLGSYESQFINEPWSLGNWAMNLATGGTGPQVTQNPLQGGPQTGFFGTPSLTSGEVQNYAGGGGGGTTTTTAPSGSVRNPFGGGPGAGTGPGGTRLTEPNLPGILGGFSAGEGAAWNTALTPPPGSKQISKDLATTNADIASVYNKGQWLTPQQEAMINQQTQANEESVAQTEGSMGLAGSTQAAMLGGEAALAGEATKGQLQAQNMQTVQNWQRIQQGFIGLGLTEQNQAFNQFTSIAQLSSAEQAQMFQEGTAGYQLMSTFMDSVLKPYGVSLQAFQDILNAQIAQVGDQVSLQSTAISADQQGQDQVISGISQVLSSLISTF